MPPPKTKSEAEILIANYFSKGKSRTNFTFVGHSGSGKTHLLRTVPLPLHIDSFDINGPREIMDDLVRKGMVVVDDRFEVEIDKSPTAFKLWSDNFERRVRDGYFKQFKSYSIDSLTFMADAIMNFNQLTYPGKNRASRAGTPPEQSDYFRQQSTLKNVVRLIGNLPCYTFLTAHIQAKDDPITGIMIATLMLAGKASEQEPTLMDEVYYIDVYEESTGIKRELITATTGKYKAKTRIGTGGKLDTREDANIKAILEKCGKPYKDGPSLLREATISS